MSNSTSSPGIDNAQQVAISYTSTHTYITLEAGNSAHFLLDFFSPVSPDNYLRQSLPYSYLTVTTNATNQNISIFGAIGQEWCGQNNETTVGNSTTVNSTSLFTIGSPSAPEYSQHGSIATWGSVVWATRPSTTSKLTQQCGQPEDVESAFAFDGKLPDMNSSVCPGPPSNGDIYAFAHELGVVNEPSSVTFAIGQSREHNVQYIGQDMASYYISQFPEIPAAVEHFLDDYDSALSESLMLDQAVRNVSSGVNEQYTDILEASVRQVFGALELAIPASTLNTSNPMVFLKEISSDGNVNTIDVILPTFPILCVMAPQWIRMLIEPLLNYLVSPGAWSLQYAIHDLGLRYPIANGHDDNQNEVFGRRPEFMPLESTGSLLSIIAVYQQMTGDTAWAASYSSLLNIYADFLVANGTATTIQLTTVDALKETSNQTMLVIQSAIALNAYSSVSGNSKYSAAAASLVDMLYTQGAGLDISRTHFTFNYAPFGSPFRRAEDPTWSVTFPLFFDSVLNLSTFPPSAASMMSTWYTQQMTPYGLPYASAVPFGITDWSFWAAATSDESVLMSVINTTHTFLTDVRNANPFQTKYGVHGGLAGLAIPPNEARSTVGANFAPLVLRGVRIEMGNNGTVRGIGTGAGPAGSGSSASGTAVKSAASRGRGASAVRVAVACAVLHATLLLLLV